MSPKQILHLVHLNKCIVQAFGKPQTDLAYAYLFLYMAQTEVWRNFNEIDSPETALDVMAILARIWCEESDAWGERVQFPVELDGTTNYFTYNKGLTLSLNMRDVETGRISEIIYEDINAPI
jgi:hypothetical protein